MPQRVGRSMPPFDVVGGDFSDEAQRHFVRVYFKTTKKKFMQKKPEKNCNLFH
jgi:hypothetical protein